MNLLVLGNDLELLPLLVAALMVHYHVEVVPNLLSAITKVRHSRVSGIVVLSPLTPEEIVELRTATNAAIVVVPGTDRPGDVVASLDAGADDVVAAPLRMTELLARLRASMRRIGRSSEDASPDGVPVLTTPDFSIDLLGRRLTRSGGTEAFLTRTEWSLLEQLARRPGRLVTYGELTKVLWGDGRKRGIELLRVNIRAIRRKVEPVPAEPKYFITVQGRGLLFDPGTRKAGTPSAGLKIVAGGRPIS